MAMMRAPQQMTFYKGVLMTAAEAKTAKEQDTKIDKALTLTSTKGLRQLIFEKASGT